MRPRAPQLFALSLLASCAGAAPHPPPPLPPPPARVAALPAPPAGPASVFDFEDVADDSLPRGWGARPKGTVAADEQVFHGGKRSARIRRDTSSEAEFSSLSRTLPIDFAGSKVELRGFLKTDGVAGFAGVWLREDGDSGTLQFDNMEDQHLTGTSDWKEYSVVLELEPGATSLVFGVLQSGTGTTWADDLTLLVDGKPVAQAPKSVRAVTPLETDHEFDGGSKVSVSGLSPVQIDNLTTLGKVWGFLKYHHPAVTGGTRHWDYDLFRVLPGVLAAPDRATADAVIVAWIDRLGPLAEPAHPPALDTKNLALSPDIAWISDEATLGVDLARRLGLAYRNRPTDGKQFYVSSAPRVGNPVFSHEPPYEGKGGDAGFRILAAYRLFALVDYWFPDRDVIGKPWDSALRAALPKIVLADTSDAYQRELMAFIAEVHDTHANLWGSLGVRPPVGKCDLPVRLRFVENQKLVVTASRALATEGAAPSAVPAAPAAAAAPALSVGDVVLDVDGETPAARVTALSRFYAASNDPTRLRDMAHAFTHGACGATANVRVRRGARTISVAVPYVHVATDNVPSAPRWHDHPGPTFQRLSPDVAYLKLSSVREADVPSYLAAAAGTKAWILDIRSYPTAFMVFALGQHLVNAPTPFVAFSVADLDNPGAFEWSAGPELTPELPHYDGKVVIVVDEDSQSQAEYTAMAFRAAPGAVVVGSTTAGADGNVSEFQLPGRYSAMFSGLGVFYPDHRPTQRVGIVADVKVTPTVAGILAGRDEVLEAAVRVAVGPKVSEATVRGMAK